MLKRTIARVTPLIVALAATLAGCGSDGEGSATSTKPLKVMSFNVLCSFCDRTFDPWEQRLAYFGDIFRRHDPDLIGLQELSPPPFNNGMEVQQVLAKAPGYAAIYFIPEAGTAYVPYPDATILYRTSRFTVVDHGQYWLSPTPDTPLSIGFARLQFARLVVWARLRDNANDGRELYFATTHFDNNSPSQEKSAPLVEERTAPVVAQEPVIVVGDFNSRPDSTAYGILTTDTNQGFVFKNSFDFVGYHIVTNQTPLPSYDTTDRIDHIFLAGKDVHWTVTDWLADLTVYGPNHKFPSDHFPIVAVIAY
ncbi:MAG: endonuclease/exonuclease/phosphatase family protein [Deltaproteobacteria bacterium]|nr:endonuclease/exonuclease/phosphatase family protein [Deltaproteobacteria bacterium]